jgi:hypothetical protein
MKRLSLILAFLASSASADPAGLAECYFERAMTAQGINPSIIDSAAAQPAIAAMTTAAVNAYEFMDQFNSLSMLNQAARLSGAEAGILDAMISCHYKFFAE